MCKDKIYHIDDNMKDQKIQKNYKIIANYMLK